MSWEKVIELDCDGQPCWSAPFRANSMYLEYAREEAKAAGWSYSEVRDEDFCSKCTKLREGN